MGPFTGWISGGAESGRVLGSVRCWARRRVCCHLQPEPRHRHPGGLGDVDIGCGIGLLTVQLALNGATHVCAIDLEKHTVGNALASAFRNEVVHQETAQDADLYPWV